MLFELSGWLADNYARGFSVFEYITLRAVLACATSLLIGLVAGPWVIRKLTALKIGQTVRSYGPETHLVKTGTPTMGGALILISIAVSTLLWADLRNRYVWVVLLVTLGPLCPPSRGCLAPGPARAVWSVTPDCGGTLMHRDHG